MRSSLIFAVAIAASVDAVVLQARQRGPPDVSECGLDAFEGHTSEALLFCSSILKSGTATLSVTRSTVTSVTVTRKTTTTVYPTSSRRPTPSPTPRPTPTPTPTPTPRPTPTPTPTPPKSSTPVPPPSSSSVVPKPSSSSVVPRPSSSSVIPKPSSSPTPVQPSSTLVSSTLVSSFSPSPTAGPACGIVAYVKGTAAYYFESSGTKNTFAACSALCKADAKCKSFGYGEANCLLFDVNAADNTNYNPMSPYTFYDVACPAELPVRKRQLDITIGLPEGITISLGLGGPRQISSACSCLITRGPAEVTVTRTTTSSLVVTATTTSVVTRTAIPDDDDWVAAPVEGEAS